MIGHKEKKRRKSRKEKRRESGRERDKQTARNKMRTRRTDHNHTLPILLTLQIEIDSLLCQVDLNSSFFLAAPTPKTGVLIRNG